MDIRIGYDIELAVASPMALIYLLHVHPSRRDDLVSPENVQVSGGLQPEEYIDSFGNHCGRINVPVGMGTVRITNQAVIRDSGELDASTRTPASMIRRSCRSRRSSSCCRAATAKSTASSCSSPGTSSATRPQAGRGCRRSSPSCTSI